MSASIRTTVSSGVSSGDVSAPGRGADPRRVAAIVGALGLVALLGGTGCATPPAARLLEVRALGPARVERGEVLRIEGSGFPPGRDGRLALAGVVRRPAEAPRAVTLERAVRAVSAERAELRVDDALLDALGGGGTFRGRVEIAFAAAVSGAASVSGAREEVVVLFVPPTAARFSGELARGRAAAGLLDFLGVEPQAELEADGVRVAALLPGSRAAAAGLRVGDVVRESEGALVTSSADLAPPPGARALHWRVVRGGEAAPLSLTLSLRGLGGAPDPEWSWAAGWLALVWLAVLLRFTPIGRRLDAARDALRGVGRVRPTRREFVAALGAGVTAALLSGGVPLPDGVDAVAALGALVALRVLVLATQGRAALRARLGATLLGEFAACCALGALLVAAGTARFTGIAEAQSDAPLGLGLLEGPVPLCAALLWFRLACGPTDGAVGGGLELARRGLAAALFAACALGGGFGAGQGLAGAVGGGLGAVVVALLASRLGALPPARRGRLAVLAVAMCAASTLLAAHPFPPAGAAMLGSASLVFVVGLLGAVIAGLRGPFVASLVRVPA